MVKTIFDNLNPAEKFTVGIIDDVSGTSLEIKEMFLFLTPYFILRARFGRVVG